MQQANSHAFITSRCQPIRQKLNICFLQRDENIAFGIDPFFKHIALIASQKRVWQGQIQIILFKPAFRAHFNNITKALCGDKRGLCPAAFNQRIGGQSCTMNNLADLTGMNSCLGTDLMQACHNRLFWGIISGQNFGGYMLAARSFQHNICKGSANIHAQTIAFGHACLLCLHSCALRHPSAEEYLPGHHQFAGFLSHRGGYQSSANEASCA